MASSFKKVGSEVDLGVTISSNLKHSQQCSEAVKKVNKLVKADLLNMRKSKDTILTLYNSLVRPLLENCVQAWCPYHQKDIEKLELSVE